MEITSARPLRIDLYYEDWEGTDEEEEEDESWEECED
jgi:hypothetical protein